MSTIETRKTPTDDGPVPHGLVGYAAVLGRFPGYRHLFLSRVISMLGDWLSLIAIIAMFREVAGSDVTAIGGLLILKLLPIFLATPVAGVVADRFSRKTIMIVSDVVRSLLVLGLLAAPATPWPIEFALLLIFFQVTASAFFEPARSAALPQLVPPAWLSTANALGAVMWSVTFALGAALGGLITDGVGWRTALVLDAVTYIVSALLVMRIVLPRRERRAAEEVDWQTMTGLRDLREGVRFIVGRPDVGTALFVKAGWSVAGAATLFLTLFGERIYAIDGRPDLGVSLLYFARAVGTGIGPLLARRLVPDESPRAMRWLIAVAFLWPAVWYFVFARTENVALAFIAIVLAHFGGSILWVYSTVMLQRSVPNEFQGRVMATDLGLATLLISISIGFYGLLAELPGADLRQLTSWMSVSLIVPASIWFWASRRWPPGNPDGSGPGS